MFIQCMRVFTYAPSAVKDAEQQLIKQLFLFHCLTFKFR